ncbi:hypothetical protein ACFFX1_44315 [Dactylosporangium sucinum]|uniref:Uncharacterized protein n=1 Tax=Dactylosporangium sucinum TaxID=1424081 RepID=A0A917TRT7_9ACTN|nr:hypothetical protein [Dactylosporangium sucinum]GGM34930.1 hypothetical protein GCM10007977_040510 [Dactylosporangium sucinum]
MPHGKQRRAAEVRRDIAPEDWLRFQRVYERAERAGDLDRMASALLEYCGPRLAGMRTANRELLLARLRELAASIDPRSSLGLQIRARLASEQGNHRTLLVIVREATEAGDPTARATALGLAHHRLLGPGCPQRPRLRRALAAELVAESARTGQDANALEGLLYQTVDLFIDGDRHAGRSLTELREVLARRQHPPISGHVQAIEVMLSIRAGRLDLAEAGAEARYEWATALEHHDATPVYWGQLAAVRWYQGRIAELLPRMHDPHLALADSGPYAMLALAAAAAGDRFAAESAIASLVGRDRPRSGWWLASMLLVVEAAVLLGDAETCARAYETLRPYADQPAVAGLAVVCLGSMQHALGLAALGAGDVDRAVEHLRLAVQDNLALRHWPALIRSRTRYAQALTRRRGADDAALAHQQVTAAREEAAALGLPTGPHDEPAAGDRGPVTCRREGQWWLLRFDGREVRVPSRSGLPYLAVLLADPARDITAAELAAGVDALRTAAREVPAPGEQDRVRSTVSKAIRRCIDSISRVDAELGRHLRATVRTGTHCSYRP